MGKYNASFYLGEDYPYWEKFLKICKREGEKASKKLREYIKDYVFKHDPGNPQTTIPSYSDDGQVTLSNIEGRIRQLCVEYRSDLYYRDILQWIKERGIDNGKARSTMAERVVSWLKSRGLPVYR